MAPPGLQVSSLPLFFRGGTEGGHGARHLIKAAKGTLTSDSLFPEHESLLFLRLELVQQKLSTVSN